jgi:hypothetical protein
LKDKGVGDELQIAIQPLPDQPTILRSLLAEHLGRLREDPGAKSKPDGPRQTVVFNVQTGLAQLEDQIRQALEGLFESVPKA